MTAKNNQEENLPPASEHLVHPSYRSDIDGLRALAVLSVVIFHAFPGSLPGGFIGVDIFFVISGFLISTIIFSSLQRNEFSFSEFYIRRIRRIFPALLTVLLACLVFGYFSLLAEEYRRLGKHIAAGAGFVSNLILQKESGYFDTAAETKPLLHLWSLGVEEQFYIMWPPFLWAAWRKRFNLLTITVVVGAISFALNLAKYKTDGVADFYSPQTRFWELLAGSLLAYATLNGGVFSQIKITAKTKINFLSLRDIQSVLGGVLLAASILLITQKNFPGVWALLPVMGALMVIAAGKDAWLNRALLSSRIMIWFGLISYPLYLWHWPLLSFARIFEEGMPTQAVRIVLVCSSILLAWATKRFIEQPLRFGKRSRESTVALVLLMSLVGIVGQITYKMDGLKHRSVVSRNMEPRSETKLEANPLTKCSIPNVSKNVFCEVYTSVNSRGEILIWGDSTAGVWLPVFLDVAKKSNFTVIRIEHPSCPPILGVRKTRFDLLASREYCDTETKQRLYEFISQMKPDLIFILSAWNSYSPYTNREFITDGDEIEANPLTTKRAIESKVPYTLERLSGIGRVIVFKSWPFLPSHPSYNPKRIDFLWHDKPYVTASYDKFKKDSELINSVLAKLGNRVEFFDPATKICDPVNCSSVYNEVHMYSDGYHITTLGAMQFRSEIENIIISKPSKIVN